VAPLLHLRCTGPGQWGGSCPVCKRGFSLGVGTKGRRFVWSCHHKPTCSEAAIYEAMRGLGVSEACLSFTRGRHRGAPSTAELAAIKEIAMDKSLSPAARQIALLLLAGMSAADARAELKLAKSTYYDAMKSLGSAGR
jgi:hypothetical protein